jgi:starch synthase (maltosyl-transferring)
LSRAQKLTEFQRAPDAALARATEPSSRIKIHAISPSIEGGSYVVKRTAGDVLEVEADLVVDGHSTLSAAVLVSLDKEAVWQRAAMAPLGNDRWRGEVLLPHEGVYTFVVEAWLDAYGGFARDLEKRLLAGVDLKLDIEEGRTLIRAAHIRAHGHVRDALDAVLSGLGSLAVTDQARLLIANETVAAMASTEFRPFLSRSFSQSVEAERKQASFASWYELFPRSQTSDSTRHGTFKDVVARLPDIAAMGFDVLYFPPIHPIGKTNRKGRNNALKARRGEPGSPYAIGSAEGGHDTVHPQLGSLADFRTLVNRARDLGISVALDFAVQCSPDHPWLKEHREWFNWRSDGSIRFAENPPKKYEDIVNVDFHAPGAIPGLWLALRNVIDFWIGQGVRIFRVDNPHTKPLAFWQWLIADVRARRPEIIFLAEAFTRPKLMYELAKIGFNQSYTYFTWRNTKSELTEYLTELSRTGVREFFRPNFFVNTPDINPLFLQSGARSAFLIRALLASTMSGLWGVYSGFELCEHEAIPGREEYKDSEKYRIKARNWKKPGNIIGEIAALNALRKREPALQSHLGITFYNAFNDQVLYYAKSARGSRDRILVIVSLDPYQPQRCDFEIPLWEWGLPDHESLAVEDLLYGYHFVWTGKIQSITLEPSAPYRVWRIRPLAEARA